VVGVFNGSIISRYLGLVDKKDIGDNLEKVLREASTNGVLTDKHLNNIAEIIIAKTSK
jgi:hypothetical protein